MKAMMAECMLMEMGGSNIRQGWSSRRPRSTEDVLAATATVPRSKAAAAAGTASAQPEMMAVTMMRRSASVPCKRSTNRGSTSSSDSGFSAGSPSQNRSAATMAAGCNVKPDEEETTGI